MINKSKSPLHGNHKIVLIGDKHIKGYANLLKHTLNSDYDLYCVVKPGSGTSELMKTASEAIKNLSHNDIVVVYSGTNDYDSNNFYSTFRNIKNYINNNIHTNILLMKIPSRYDLHNSLSINKNIAGLNRKLMKLVKAFPYASFLETIDDRMLFTKHYSHRNNLGKKLVNLQLAQNILTIFSQKLASPIMVDWPKKCVDRNLLKTTDLETIFSRKTTYY